MPTIYKQLTVNDMHTDTLKVTTGIFTGGAGTLDGTSMATASISSSNTSYFYTLTEGSGSTAVDRFDVSYGNINGLGGSSTDYRKVTEAVYKQLANIILPYSFSSGSDNNPRFYFKDISGSTGNLYEDDVYALIVKKDSTEDRLDGKFTITLAGSTALDITSGSTLHLTNLTSSLFYENSIVGHYYKIVSGTAGTPATASEANMTNYGHFYPEISTIILSATRLSASLPGITNRITSGSDCGGTIAELTTLSGSGFAMDLATDGTADNAGKMVMALRKGAMTMRSENDKNVTTYYCRLFHNEFNHTSNPTFLVSGSIRGDIRPEFVGDPNVYVTTIGLYNSSRDLIAVAKLSEPQKKNFGREMTIAAKMDG